MTCEHSAAGSDPESAGASTGSDPESAGVERSDPESAQVGGTLGVELRFHDPHGSYVALGTDVQADAADYLAGAAARFVAPAADPLAALGEACYGAVRDVREPGWLVDMVDREAGMLADRGRSEPAGPAGLADWYAYLADAGTGRRLTLCVQIAEILVRRGVLSCEQAERSLGIAVLLLNSEAANCVRRSA